MMNDEGLQALCDKHNLKFDIKIHGDGWYMPSKSLQF